MLVFSIAVGDAHNSKNYVVTVQPVNALCEHYILLRGNEKIIIKSNRPIFRRKKLKHRRPQLSLIEGDVSFSVLEKMGDALWPAIQNAEASGQL